jgi:hypothetical protein
VEFSEEPESGLIEMGGGGLRDGLFDELARLLRLLSGVLDEVRQRADARTASEQIGEDARKSVEGNVVPIPPRFAGICYSCFASF